MTRTEFNELSLEKFKSKLKEEKGDVGSEHFYKKWNWRRLSKEEREECMTDFDKKRLGL